MAKINPDGSISGKVGNVIYTEWLGRKVMKANGRCVQPHTFRQKLHWRTLKAINKLINDNTDYFKSGFQKSTTHLQATDEAKCYHMDPANGVLELESVEVSYKDKTVKYIPIIDGKITPVMNSIEEDVKEKQPFFKVNYGKLKLSRGMIPAPDACTITRDDTNYLITWAKSLVNMAWHEDYLSVVLFAADGTSKGFKNVAIRKDYQVTIPIPDVSQTYHAYCYFSNPEKYTYESQEKISNSVYLGVN